MHQQAFSHTSFEQGRKKTHMDQLQDKVESIIRWEALTAAIDTFYPKPEGAGAGEEWRGQHA